MDDRIACSLVNGVHMVPADIVEDQQMPWRSQGPFHLSQSLFHPPEVGQGIVADQTVEISCGKGQVMDIRLDQGGIRFAFFRLGQHVMGEIQRVQIGRRVALAEDRDQCARAGADFQNGPALAEKGVIGR